MCIPWHKIRATEHVSKAFLKTVSDQHHPSKTVSEGDGGRIRGIVELWDAH